MARERRMVVDCKNACNILQFFPAGVCFLTLWIQYGLIIECDRTDIKQVLSLGLRDHDASAFGPWNCEQAWASLLDDKKHVAHLPLLP